MSVRLTANDELLFQEFVQRQHLSEQSAQQFKLYLTQLLAYNEQFNLTTITTINSIIHDHFQDSLSVVDYITKNNIKMIADVGSGGGFPGLALKIAMPSLSVVLIEVNNKKVTFLNDMIQQMQLSDIFVYTQDWRTFLRTTTYPIDLFCARASLAVEELMRMFKPGCVYTNATLVYWASRLWQATAEEQSFIHERKEYCVGSKERVLVFFKKKSNEGIRNE